MDPDFLPKATHEQQEYLLSNVKDWSILNGLAVRPSAYLFSAGTDLSGALATTAPVTLYPSLFPKACFDEARAIQKAYNELYAAIARDREWLKHIVERYLNSISAYPPASPHVVTPTSFPTNPCTDSLSLGFSTAHCAYGPSKSSPPLPL
ncbi:MAG: hypothetical protein Q9180_002481, partial [Flavoplaca navasiana]